jgi:pimeloyl-ACP methyl ester carboxylesterase
VTGRHIFDRWSDHIDRLLDRASLASAPLVGVSFGGLVAAHYAATRPDRVSRLVLVSTPAPGWRMDDRTARLARRPRLLSPVFAWRAVGHVRHEIAAALPSVSARVALAANHTARALTCPLSPSRMAAWVHEWAETDLATTLARIRTPTLVMTGEPSLDRIVPVASSLEYLSIIPGSQHVILERTGHLGFTTRPREFARLVTHFVDGSSSERAPERPRASRPA